MGFLSVTPFPSLAAATRVQRLLPVAAAAYLVGLVIGLVIPWFRSEGLTVGFAVGFAIGVVTFIGASLWERRCRTRAEQHALQRRLTFAERRQMLAYTAAGELAPDHLLPAQEIHTRGRKAGIAVAVIALLVLAGPLAAMLYPVSWARLLPALALMVTAILPIAVWLLRADAGTARVHTSLHTPPPTP